jgi:hypothetical protein
MLFYEPVDLASGVVQHLHDSQQFAVVSAAQRQLHGSLLVEQADV